MSDQDRVYDALHEKLQLLQGPWPVEPKWWQFQLRRADKRIQAILKLHGLPRLTPEGRLRYYSADPQGFEDAGGAWSRKWCAALGLSYRDAYTDKILPRLKEPTHD